MDGKTTALLFRLTLLPVLALMPGKLCTWFLQIERIECKRKEINTQFSTFKPNVARQEIRDEGKARENTSHTPRKLFHYRNFVASAISISFPRQLDFFFFFVFRFFSAQQLTRRLELERQITMHTHLIERKPFEKQF